MIASRFVRIAVLWFLAGVCLGAYMGATHQFQDRQVHVHGNLLGWASCALFALIHRAWPSLQGCRGARAHFWLHNVGLLVFIAGLALLPRASAMAEPMLGVGSVLLLIATAMFCVAVWQVTSGPLRSGADLHARPLSESAPR